MAGKKIQAQLTPEEKLQQALVPEAEQPYKVPANWCWTKLGSISLIKGGKRLPPGKKLNDIKTGYPYIRVTDFDSNSVDVNNIKYIDEETYKILDNYKISINDIYISIAGSIGKVGIIPEILNGAILTENAAKITNIILQNQIYLLYILCSEFCQNQMKESAIATTQSKLALFRIANIKLPLPPLAEQQRIVERIESLFAKVDEAKENLQNVLDEFETRKAAILHKAFTGELTANWRKQHGVSMDSWEEKKLQEVCSMKITDGTHKTPTYCDKEVGIPFLSSKDITSERICWNNIKYITKELHEELYARLTPQIDDILLAKNGTTGVAAIVDVDKVFDIYVTLALLRPKKEIINPMFLLKILNSPYCKKQFNEHLTGIGLPNLHLRDIRQVSIFIPTIPEQSEIVHIIDNLLAKEQQAKELAENSLAKIDLIKKSILARAFRGELGTNNPADEPAVELLKLVL